jgi:pyridoxamine 5'-phosphate oxidase
MRAMIPPTELLAEPLPAEPLQTAAEWLVEAWNRRQQPNANAMILATASADGKPSARVVLCKDIVARPGYVVFYTNYRSRKARELEGDAHAAAVMHWDYLHRQVRIEGLVRRSPEAESDAYFASRGLESRIGAWASAQSEPVASRAQLLEAVDEAARRFGSEVPRPPHWGGYRLWAEAVELWVEGEARMHDRARWSRELELSADGTPVPGPWSVTRLQP